MLDTESINGFYLMNNISNKPAKIYINNHEIADYDDFMKVAKENILLTEKQNKIKKLIEDYKKVYPIYI